MEFILRNLQLMHSGPMADKIKASFFLAVGSSPIYWLIEKFNDWYFENYGYVIFVFIAIIFDHFLGTWVHAFIKRDFSMKRNIIGFFTKIFLVIMVAVLVEGVANILGPQNLVTEYFAVISRLMVFIYPAGSALVNVSLITKGKFPPTAWMEKIMRFNKSMDINDFKEEDNEQEP